MDWVDDGYPDCEDGSDESDNHGDDDHCDDDDKTTMMMAIISDGYDDCY